MDVIRASVPFFLGLILLEVIVARLRRRNVYRLSDSISDLSCGILSQLAGVFIALGTLAAFSWISTHASVQTLFSAPRWIARSPIHGGGIDVPGLLSWVGVFLIDDLAYYWMHRISHHVNILWAGHVVHHSSEEFNLTVALRQSSLHGFMSWIFYMPIAFLGVPAAMWFVVHAINLVYQFWVHTQEVNRLGPLELILNTPSHHRVHHGVNPEYQDKNFAGILIIWDRMFGTFTPEVAPPVYGITKPLASWNPLLANVHVFRDIWRNARVSRTLRDRLQAVFGHPRWRPPSERAAAPATGPAATFERFEPPVPGALKSYALVQFAVVLLGAILLLDALPRLPATTAFAGAFYVVLSLGNIGGILEARSWARVSELLRLAVLGAVALIELARMGNPASVAALAGAAVFAAASMTWLVRLRPLLTSPDVRAIVVM